MGVGRESQRVIYGWGWPAYRCRERLWGEGEGQDLSPFQAGAVDIKDVEDEKLARFF